MNWQKMYTEIVLALAEICGSLTVHIMMTPDFSHVMPKWTCGFEFNKSTNNRWIVIKFCTTIHVQHTFNNLINFCL